MVYLMLIYLFFFSETFYQATRGHNFKLNKQHFHKNVRSHALSLRVINNWNSLPDYIVNTNSLVSFKQFRCIIKFKLLYLNLSYISKLLIVATMLGGYVWSEDTLSTTTKNSCQYFHF